MKIAASFGAQQLGAAQPGAARLVGSGAHPATTPPVWTNPAAAAALRSTVDLLRGIEDGIVRNFADAERVRSFSADLKSTIDIFDTATSAITGDESKENDSFLPQINIAGGGVSHAETRLSAKDFTSTWPLERGEILAAIRRARAISQNVADQLDPRSVRLPG